MKTMHCVLVFCLCPFLLWAEESGIKEDVNKNAEVQVKIEGQNGERVNVQAPASVALTNTSVLPGEMDRLTILEKRVYDLERAMSHVQDVCLRNESSVIEIKEEIPDVWSCRIETFSQNYLGIGPTRAIAEKKVMDECKLKSKKPFLCDQIKCQSAIMKNDS